MPKSRDADEKELKRKQYARLFEPMQGRLLQMARWIEHTGRRLLVLFEGRDTAGKGGVIGDIARTLNPRQ
jgi:polyphosphate kinase 2 (PPK2 family)